MAMQGDGVVRRYLKFGAVLVAAMSLAACASADLTPEDERVVRGADVVDRSALPLTSAEISIYLTDSTLSHVGDDRVWHVYLGRGGMLVGLARSRDGAGERNRGQWSVREGDAGAGVICRQWERDWGGGTQGCATVYRYGNEYVFIPEGAADRPEDGIRRTRSPGDSEKVV